MNPQVSTEYISQIQDQVIKVTSHFIKSTRLIPNATLLKIGEYNLVCSPAIMGFSRMDLLLVLSEGEQNLFRKFQGTIQALILSFEAAIPSCPGGLSNTLALYFRGQEERKLEFEEKGNNLVDFSDLTMKWIGFSQNPEFQAGGKNYPFLVQKLSTTQGEVQWEKESPSQEEKEGFFRFHPLDGSYTVAGSWEASGQDQSAKIKLTFSNEHMSFLDDLVFRKTLKEQKEGK